MVVSRLWLCGLMLPDLRPFMARKAKPLRTVLSRLGTCCHDWVRAVTTGYVMGACEVYV